MIAVEVQHFLDRARDLQKGVEGLVRENIYLLNDEVAKFKHSPALLGIHCAMSYCDALRIGMGRTILSSDDHRIAASDLESLLESQDFENRKGIDHLKKLVRMKSKIAYAPTGGREIEVEEIVIQAVRFADWAEETGEALKIEGW